MLSRTVLSGENIILGSFIDEDIKKIIEWHADEKIMRNLDALPVKPKRKQKLRSGLMSARKTPSGFRSG